MNTLSDSVAMTFTLRSEGTPLQLWPVWSPRREGAVGGCLLSSPPGVPTLPCRPFRGGKEKEGRPCKCWACPGLFCRAAPSLRSPLIGASGPWAHSFLPSSLCVEDLGFYSHVSSGCCFSSFFCPYRSALWSPEPLPRKDVRRLRMGFLLPLTQKQFSHSEVTYL